MLHCSSLFLRNFWKEVVYHTSQEWTLKNGYCSIYAWLLEELEGRGNPKWPISSKFLLEWATANPKKKGQRETSDCCWLVGQWVTRCKFCSPVRISGRQAGCSPMYVHRCTQLSWAPRHPNDACHVNSKDAALVAWLVSPLDPACRLHKKGHRHTYVHFDRFFIIIVVVVTEVEYASVPMLC